MGTRLLVAMVVLVSSVAFAGSRTARPSMVAQAHTDTPPKNQFPPPPREINVVDDVGVGDHFPSQVPGAAPYRLPPSEVQPPPPAPGEPQKATPEVPARRPIREVPREAPQLPPFEELASDPSEWAAAPAASAAPAAVAPAEPTRAVAAAAVSTPAPAAPVVVASASLPDLEREMLDRASTALLQGTCESELPRLAELFDRTESSGIKARVRVLRARCFSHRSQSQKARAEYAAYLREFPEGLSAAEAREALGN